MNDPDLPVLITGAAGFVGAACARTLRARGRRVLALDVDLAQGRLPTDDPGIERIEGDIRDAALIDGLVARAERVLHLAAIAGVHHYIERTRDVLDVNILGTRNVLMSAFARGRPVVAASTSEIYGKNTTVLHEHADTLLGPAVNARWSYATSKLAGEHYAWALAREGLPIAIVRYFNVYGTGLDRLGEGRVVSTFLGRLLDGQPLRLVDGGHAVRCLCHIDDATAGTLALLDAIGPGSPVAGRPFNVGNPEPVSMRTLAERMIALSGRDVGLDIVRGVDHFGPGFEDIPHRVPDVEALAEATGFRARISLDEGLRRTLADLDLLASAPRPTPPAPIPVIRPMYDADDALLARLRDSLDRGVTTNAGPQVTALEAEAGAWLGAPHTLAVSSGAAGLEVAVRAVVAARGVSGGAALLPSFTYIATLNAVETAGLRPVFVDIDLDTWTLCPDALARALATTPDAAVVMPVCAFGVPPGLGRIAPLARAAGAAVVYDAAHAVGAVSHGARWPAEPDVTVYSLHATKVLPATEGGLLCTGSATLAASMAAIRAHGLTPDPLDAVPGLNAKMDELAGAVARHGLARLDATLVRRRRAYDVLTDALRQAGWTVQHVPDGVTVNGQNLCARPPVPRAEATAILDAHGVGWRLYFHPALHALRRLAPQPGLPVTDAVTRDLLCLPIHARMAPETLDRMAAAFAAVGASRRSA